MGHYETLGVSQNASDAEIKKAYRKLSLQYHPDRNNNADAQDKIREINDAYDTIGDSSKRKQYDMELKFGDNPFAHLAGGNMPFMRMPTAHDSDGDIGELFSALFGGMMGGESPNVQIFHGGMPGMGGMGGIPGMGGGPRILRKPVTISKTIKITLEQAYHGCKLPIEIERNVMIGDVQIAETETLYVDIFPGIDNNECITIGEKGNVTAEQLKGDVKILILLENSTSFRRQGLDLAYDKTISLKESLCGFSFKLKHIHGNELLFNNNANTTVVKPGFKKVIPNMGMNRENNTGSLIINFHVEFPNSISSEQIESLNQVL